MRGAHGFAEGEDAAGMILCLEKIEPLVNVVTFEESVGGERAAAFAVGAGVGEEDGESVGEEELSVSGHAEAVVAEAVEQEDGVSVGLVRMDDPGAEDDVAGRGDGDVDEIGVEGVDGLANSGGFIFGEFAAGRVERAVGQIDSADDAEGDVQQ